MATTVRSVAASAAAARAASRELATASSAAKDEALRHVAQLLRERGADVLAANEADLADERAAALTAALRDRLALDEARVAAMADGVGEIVALPDPVGEQIEARTLASGIELQRVRVPLGVVAVVYEARPNVTIDCAALTIKSGNAIVLRGSSYAERSNGALAAIVRAGLAEAGLPEDAVVMLSRRRAREPARAGDPGRADRPADPARRGGAEGRPQGGGDGAGDLRRRRQLPRLRPRRRRSGDGAKDRLRRQGRPPGRLQRSRDAARQRRRRPGLPARDPSPTCMPPASSWSATSAPARPPARSRSAPRPRRTGTPSSST